MKSRLTQLARFYFLSAWLPATLVVTLVGLVWLNEFSLRVPYTGYLFLIGVPIGMLGILTAAIIQFVRGFKARDVISSALLPVTAVVGAAALASSMVAAMFNKKPDNFGKNIVIPPDMSTLNATPSELILYQTEDGRTRGSGWFENANVRCLVLP